MTKPDPFNEIDRLMGEYEQLLRQANIEKRVAMNALQMIASGIGDAHQIAVNALITLERLRTPAFSVKVENAELLSKVVVERR